MSIITIFNILAVIIGYIVYDSTGKVDYAVGTMLFIIVLGFAFY